MVYGQIMLNTIPDIIATMVGLLFRRCFTTKYIKWNGRI